MFKVFWSACVGLNIFIGEIAYVCVRCCQILNDLQTHGIHYLLREGEEFLSTDMVERPISEISWDS